MRYLLILLPFFPLTILAQNSLEFDKRFVESEDKWVAFQMDKDSSYPFGFIYIDAMAGLTLNYEGRFKISPEGRFIAKKLDSTSLKVRLKPNNVQVAFIPEDKFEELQISAVPDWLKIYRTDTASVGRLYRWGYLYNGWNECRKALSYLEKAEKINPKFKGLSVELAFSYNCLGDYVKAISVLQEALRTDPTDAYINKELIYAQTKSGQLDKAAENCKKALLICTDKTYNGEMCYNLLHTFYEKKDKKNFRLWIDETRKWTSSNANLTRSIIAMEEDLLK